MLYRYSLLPHPWVPCIFWFKGENVILSFSQDILQYAEERKLNSATQIPYFDGDFWSSVLEDIIDELKQEEATKVKTKPQRIGCNNNQQGCN